MKPPIKRFVCVLCNRSRIARRALLLSYDSPACGVVICLPCCVRALDEPEQEIIDWMHYQIARDPARYLFQFAPYTE
jgi:hypothetical protein